MKNERETIMAMERALAALGRISGVPEGDVTRLLEWAESAALLNKQHDPDREARASAVVGDERDGRKESVPPAAPQPATLLMERLCVHGYERCQACEDLRAAPQTPAEPVHGHCPVCDAPIEFHPSAVRSPQAAATAPAAKEKS